MVLEEKKKEINKLKQETEELEKKIGILLQEDSQDEARIQELDAIFELLEVKNALISQLEGAEDKFPAECIALDFQLDEDASFLSFGEQKEAKAIDGKKEISCGILDAEEKQSVISDLSSVGEVEVMTVKFGENGPILFGNSRKSMEFLIEEDWKPSTPRDIGSESPKALSPSRSLSPKFIASHRSLERSRSFEKIKLKSPEIPEKKLFQDSSRISRSHEDPGLLNIPTPDYWIEEEDEEWIPDAMRQEMAEELLVDYASSSTRDNCTAKNSSAVIFETDKVDISVEKEDLALFLNDTLMEEVPPPPSRFSSLAEVQGTSNERKTIKEETRIREVIRKEPERFPIGSDIMWSSVHRSHIHRSSSSSEISDNGIETIPASGSRRSSDEEEWIGMEIAIRNSLENQDSRENAGKQDGSTSTKEGPESRDRKASRKPKRMTREIRKKRSFMPLLPQELSGKKDFMNFLQNIVVPSEDEPIENRNDPIIRQEEGRTEEFPYIPLADYLSEEDDLDWILEAINRQEMAERTGDQADDTNSQQKQLENGLIIERFVSRQSENTILIMGVMGNVKKCLRLSSDRSQWIETNLKFPDISWSGAVYFNEEIYLIGGRTNPKAAYKLDKNLDWKQLADMNTGRNWIGKCCLAWDGHIWVLGGRDNNEELASVERYDPKEDSWTFMPDMVYCRYHAAAVIWNNCIVTSGDSSNGMGNTVKCYDPKNGLWTELPNMPAALRGHSLVSFENKLVIMGGYDGQTHDSVWQLDPQETNSNWKPLPPMKRASSNFAGIVFDGEIYAIGGYQSWREYQHRVGPWTEIFDGQEWRDGPNLPYAWIGKSAMIIPQKLACRL